MDSTYRLRLPFRDIDMHGHMHNVAYVSHFEAAIGHALRAVGLEADFAPNETYVFLVRKVEVTYAAPCYFDQEIAIETRLTRVGGSSLTFALEMTAEDQSRSQAEIVWICVDKATSRPKEIPGSLRERLSILT